MDYQTDVEDLIVALSNKLGYQVLRSLGDEDHMITVCDENDNCALLFTSTSIAKVLTFLGGSNFITNMIED